MDFSLHGSYFINRPMQSTNVAKLCVKHQIFESTGQFLSLFADNTKLSRKQPLPMLYDVIYISFLGFYSSTLHLDAWL